MVKKYQFFYKTPLFWYIMTKNLSFSDKTPLDWVRPPPWSKKSEYFLIRIFWIGRDPPAPLLTKSKKKQYFFFTPPLRAEIFL